MSIRIDQNEYTEKWIDEIELTAERAKQNKSQATPSEIGQLRGLIGLSGMALFSDQPSFSG